MWTQASPLCVQSPLKSVFAKQSSAQFFRYLKEGNFYVFFWFLVSFSCFFIVFCFVKIGWLTFSIYVQKLLLFLWDHFFINHLCIFVSRLLNILIGIIISLTMTPLCYNNFSKLLRAFPWFMASTLFLGGFHSKTLEIIAPSISSAYGLILKCPVFAK